MGARSGQPDGAVPVGNRYGLLSGLERFPDTGVLDENLVQGDDGPFRESGERTGRHRFKEDAVFPFFPQFPAGNPESEGFGTAGGRGEGQLSLLHYPAVPFQPPSDDVATEIPETESVPDGEKAFDRVDAGDGDVLEAVPGLVVAGMPGHPDPLPPGDGFRLAASRREDAGVIRHTEGAVRSPGTHVESQAVAQLAVSRGQGSVSGADGVDVGRFHAPEFLLHVLAGGARRETVQGDFPEPDRLTVHEKGPVRCAGGPGLPEADRVIGGFSIDPEPERVQLRRFSAPFPDGGNRVREGNRFSLEPENGVGDGLPVQVQQFVVHLGGPFRAHVQAEDSLVKGLVQGRYHAEREPVLPDGQDLGQGGRGTEEKARKEGQEPHHAGLISFSGGAYGDCGAPGPAGPRAAPRRKVQGRVPSPVPRVRSPGVSARGSPP